MAEPWGGHGTGRRPGVGDWVVDLCGGERVDVQSARDEHPAVGQHQRVQQVELARLQYLSTRLVRRWSHLERQRGASNASLRAVMAATGQMGTASSDALISSDAAAFGQSKARLLQDYDIQGGVLKARENEYDIQATGAWIKGVTGAMGAGAQGGVNTSLLAK